MSTEIDYKNDKNTVINIESINCFYGGFHAIHDLNLTIEQGDTVVLLGPSGAGKSTLMRVFNLLEIPKSGCMSLNAYQFNFSKKIKESDIKEIRKKVGIIFQNYNLWPHLTVLDNLIKAPKWVLSMSDVAAKNEAMKILERLNIAEFSDRFPLHLSGGQQQRVAIARALMMHPDILLFDEPTAALDPGITSQVANIINELSILNITQIVVTHDVSFAKKIGSKIVYMEHGKVIEIGSNTIFEHPKTDEFKHYLSHTL